MIVGIPLARTMSAYGGWNEINQDDVNDYYEMLDCVTGSLTDPPPVDFYTMEITENDVDASVLDNIGWLNGDPVTDDDIGLTAYMIMDGHHRCLAAMMRQHTYILGNNTERQEEPGRFV